MTHLVPLAQALGPLRDVYQHLITAAVRWQDGRPRRTDPDQFVLLCVAVDAGSGSSASPTRWTRTSVYRVLRRDVPNWCSVHRCPWPVELPEAMWEWLDFLSGTGRLDAASDPLWELRKPLLCYGGLDAQGRLRDGHPGEPLGVAGSGPPAVACECDLPYRETAAVLNRLGRRCAERGHRPLDVLRCLVGDDDPPDADELDALLRGLGADGNTDGNTDGNACGNAAGGTDTDGNGWDRGRPPGFPDDAPPW